MDVPESAYYGAQTARAISNFPISGEPMPFSFIQALALIKKHAAKANGSLKNISPQIAEGIIHAANEVLEGKWRDQFPVDVFQTGSGTSTNMNMNEVLAHRACEILSGSKSSKSVHANDHVNYGQSSNDVIPTALHISASIALKQDLLPALRRLHAELVKKADKYFPVIKIGRTHYQD
ncbi:MAG: fumC, partial [Verrucomicrobiales bacterium]|nr:fumC [Verrucomicrobiales bacterium]